MRHIDRTRTVAAKDRTMTRRNQRRAKSAVLFLAWAFGPAGMEG